MTVTRSAGIPGVLEIGSGRTTAFTGFQNGQRVAKATVDLASLTLPGGFTFKGLHWEVTHTSGGGAKPQGSFSVNAASGPASALGTVLRGLDPLALLEKLSAVTGPALGFQVTLPRVHLDNGTLFVDPLSISVVPNSVRDRISNQLLDAIQPLREQLVAALFKITCQVGTPLTVADIAVGALTGAGSMNIRLGGVQATTGDVTLSDYLGGSLGDAVPELGGGAPEASTGGGFAAPGDLAATAPASETAPAGDTTSQAATAAPTTRGAASRLPLPKGKRGGALLGIGLGVLGCLAAMAEADRRKMIKARHRIPGGA